MDPVRYNQLMRDETLNLTAAEIEAGWHFCGDFDGLLMGLGANGCTCKVKGVN